MHGQFASVADQMLIKNIGRLLVITGEEKAAIIKRTQHTHATA